MHHQCVAPLAANSLHSGISWASSIAFSKVMLCRARSFFRVAIQEVCRVAQLAFSTHSGELQSEFSSRRLTHPFWPDDQTAWVSFFCMIVVRGDCLVRQRTPQLETRWYQRISRILLRHHWSNASTFLASTFDRAQHSDPYSIIGDLDFADDISLLAELLSLLIPVVQAFVEEAATIGLEVNWDKTKVQALGTQQPDTETLDVHGHQVAVVDEFVYLGAITHSSVLSSYDIHRRSGLTRSAMQKSDNCIWKSRLSLSTKLKLYYSINGVNFKRNKKWIERPVVKIMAIWNCSKMAAAAILDLFEPYIASLDPPSLKTPP